jgi:Zn-dependent membrane protease YugP
VYPYWLFVLPGMVLALVATIVVRLSFARYARVGVSSGLTGAQAARRLLDAQGLRTVRVEAAHGFLSDHYDPTSRTLRLSPDVYRLPSLAAIGVACHEAGHALQHATGFGWLGMRSALVPATQFGSHASYVFFLLGVVLNSHRFFLVACILFSLVVVFSLVALPVEWDASARAKRLMVAAGIVSPRERDDAGRVLNAAFLTYVASAVTAILTLLYYLARSGLLGGRRDD